MSMPARTITSGRLDSSPVEPVAAVIRCRVPVAVGAMVAAAFALAPADAEAANRFIVKSSIYQHLEKTADTFHLCQRRGMSMKQMVLFMPNGGAGTSVYWDSATDLFVEYPGMSACTVWKRLGATAPKK